MSWPSWLRQRSQLVLLFSLTSLARSMGSNNFNSHYQLECIDNAMCARALAQILSPTLKSLQIF